MAAFALFIFDFRWKFGDGWTQNVCLFFLVRATWRLSSRIPAAQPHFLAQPGRRLQIGTSKDQYMKTTMKDNLIEFMWETQW